MLVTLDDDLATADIVESYTQVSWTERLYTPGTWTAQIIAGAEGLNELTAARFATVKGSGVAMIVRKVERGTDRTLTVVSGPTVDDLMNDRLCLPTPTEPVDEVTGPAETRMRHYVTRNAGGDADADRQLPRFTVAADEARGKTGTSEARFQTIAEILTAVGEDAEIGWRVRYDQTGRLLVWEPVVGTDRSADVFLDVDLDSATALRWMRDEREVRNVAYVAGPGEGVLRDVVVRPDVPEAGFDRREGFVDARDAESVDALDGKGDEWLAEHRHDEATEVDVHRFGSFTYGTDFTLGDWVLARNARWDLERVVQVVEATTTVTTGGRTISVGLGKPWPRLTERPARRPTATSRS